MDEAQVLRIEHGIKNGVIWGLSVSRFQKLYYVSVFENILTDGPSNYVLCCPRLEDALAFADLKVKKLS